MPPKPNKNEALIIFKLIFSKLSSEIALIPLVSSKSPETKLSEKYFGRLTKLSIEVR